jgi:hypothetical protein
MLFSSKEESLDNCYFNNLNEILNKFEKNLKNEKSSYLNLRDLISNTWECKILYCVS